MLKNPAFLVAVALLVAAGVWFLARHLEPTTDLQPLKPSPGESLRHQFVPPKPVREDPKLALAALEAAQALQPGDQVLRELLRGAVAAGELPTFRSAMSFPFTDQAAQQVADEVREWLGRKMAGLGFDEAVAKPTVLWSVQIDLASDGRYTIKVVLRASGQQKYDGTFELPAAFKANRMETTLGPGFASPAAPSGSAGK